MINERNQNIQEISWKEARETIKYVDRELVDIIDSLDPPKDHTLFKVSYKYGDIVLREGLLHLPDCNGRMHPISSPEIPNNIREKLSYSNFPLGFITKGGNEVFLEDFGHIASLVFFTPGTILGLWETLDLNTTHFPRKIWNVIAGARTLFMLPKISEAMGHNKLKKNYGLKIPPPKRMFDHANVFTDLVKSKLFKDGWTNEIVFFTNRWNDKKIKQKDWWKYRLYLLEQAWRLSSYNRNIISYNCVWQYFAKALENQQKKVSNYIMGTFKHIIAIGLGAVPGYKPVGVQQFSGPVHMFQDIYVNDYNLRSYIPTLMEPFHFNQDDDVNSVYYSLQAPNLLETVPKSRNLTKFIAEMRELKILTDMFYNEALNGRLKIENTVLEWFINNVIIDYFHSEKDIYGEIRQSKEMPQEDKSLIFTQHEYKNNIFAENSPFVRGCVRLSKIKR